MCHLLVCSCSLQHGFTYCQTFMAKETRNTSLTLKCKNDWHFVSHDSLICMTPTPHLSFFTANGLFWTKQCKSVDLLWLLAALACNIIPSFSLFLSYNMHINMHTNTASFGPLWAVWSLCSPPAFLSGSPFLSPWSHWSTGALLARLPWSALQREKSFILHLK